MNWKTVEKKQSNKRYQQNTINEYIDWYKNDNHKKKVFITCKGGHFVYGLLAGVKNSRQKTIYRVIERKWRDKQ